MGRLKGSRNKPKSESHIEALGTLSPIALRILLQLLNASDGIDFISGNEKSAGAINLARRGWIQRFSVIGSRQRWKLTVELSEEDIAFIGKMINSTKEVI